MKLATLINLMFGIVLFVLLSCKKDEIDIACQPYTPPSSIDRYDFPLRPGDPNWAALRTGQEMIDTLQIPESVLATISTVGLMETCLDYPLLSNMLAYISLQRGAIAQFTNFNGFHVLKQRPEAGSLLLDRYTQMNPTCLGGLSTLQEKGSLAFSFTYIEMVLAQDDYLSKLAAEQKKQLMREALIKYQQKKDRVDIHGIFGLKTTVFLMARLMVFNQYKPFTDAVATDDFLKVFLADVELQGRNQTLDTIVNYAKSF
jgi:hypothetical protein